MIIKEFILIGLLIMMMGFFAWFLSKYYTPVRYWLIIFGFLLYGFITLNLFNEIKGYPVHEKSIDKLAVVIHNIKTENMLYYWIWSEDNKEPRVFSFKRTDARDKEFDEIRKRLNKRQAVYITGKPENKNDHEEGGIFALKSQNEVLPK